MAITVTFEEEYKTSRAIDMSASSFQQNFVFFICGDFLDEANIDATYGPDDDIEALKAAYNIVPLYRTMPLYGGGQIFLTLSSLQVEQISYDTWKVSGGYSAEPHQQDPDNAGPAAGDRAPGGGWTNNFVQLSFNVGSQQEQRSMSLQLIDIKKNSGFGNQNVPYAVGSRQPVGHTEDGVEGAPIFQRSFSFGITAYFRPADLTFAYVRRLYRMATTLNDKSFFGFPAGSVLFTEASATGDLYSVVPVTFEFLMRPNFKFSATLPDKLMDPDTDVEAEMYDRFYDPYFPDPNAITFFPGNAFSGWSTVDYRYLPVADNTAKMMLQKPALRLIHQQYFISNFDKFNL